MSRTTLGFYNLTQQPDQDICLKIPLCALYHPVIDRAFPKVQHIGWRSASKHACYTFIKSIDIEVELPMLQIFLEMLHHTLLLGKPPHLEPYFDDELDEAYALNFNFEQGVDPLTYTTEGQLEHDAKEEQHAPAIIELANLMGEMIRSHPSLHHADIIASVPPRPSKKFHLPDQLVKSLGIHLHRSVGLKLIKKDVPKLKGLSLEEKVEALADAFTLGEPVEGKSILLIDDLYQSGVTLWSLAKFLKSKGASEVFGLACVKSWRDTDNIA